MKKVLIFSFVLFFILAVFTGCDNVDIKNYTLPPTTSESVIEMPTTTLLEPENLPNNNIAALIKYNLEALTQNDPIKILDETGFLDIELFNEIVALGEDALPYLLMLTDKSYEEISWFSNIEFEHRIWAVHAIYAIKPETYDLFFPSPDNKYTARVIVDSFRSFFNHGRSFNDIYIIENSTNKIVYKTDMKNDFTVGVFYPDVSWSADNRFAVINCCGRRSGNTMAIDMKSKYNIYLPGAKEMINHVFPGEDADDLLITPRTWISPESWETEKIIKIEFIIMVIKDGKDFSGWYTYDLTQKKILKIEFSFDDR